MSFFIAITMMSCSYIANGGSDKSALFYARDSLFSFEVSSQFQKIQDEPNRIVLEYDNRANPDYANIIIISKIDQGSEEAYMEYVQSEVDQRNEKGEYKLQLIEGNDSIRHYQFSQGPKGVDDWYMIKSCGEYSYGIYYSGQEISKDEAMRFYHSFKEWIYEPAQFIEAGDSYRLYRDIDLAFSAAYDFDMDNDIPPDEAYHRRPFIRKKLLHRLVSYPTPASRAHILVNVHELLIDGLDYLSQLEDELKKTDSAYKYIRRTQFKGCEALEMALEYGAEENENDIYTDVSVIFLYKNKLYNISVIGGSEVVNDCFKLFTETVELL